MVKPKKKNSINIVNILSDPRTIIIFLCIVIVILTISSALIKKQYKFLSGEISDKNVLVAEVHYYTSPTVTYLFTNNAVYTGENNPIVKELSIGYYVKEGDNYKEIGSSDYQFKDEDKRTLKDAVLAFSKFKVAENTSKIFTKDVKKNIDNLYLVIKAKTLQSDEFDINEEYKVEFYKVTK
jgi:hypothetical protein